MRYAKPFYLVFGESGGVLPTPYCCLNLRFSLHSFKWTQHISNSHLLYFFSSLNPIDWHRPGELETCVSRGRSTPRRSFSVITHCPVTTSYPGTSGSLSSHYSACLLNSDAFFFTPQTSDVTSKPHLVQCLEQQFNLDTYKMNTAVAEQVRALTILPEVGGPVPAPTLSGTQLVITPAPAGVRWALQTPTYNMFTQAHM